MIVLVGRNIKYGKIELRNCNFEESWGGSDEENHNGQSDFGGCSPVKRGRFCLAYWRCASAFMGRAPWFLLSRVLPSAC